MKEFKAVNFEKHDVERWDRIMLEALLPFLAYQNLENQFGKDFITSKNS